MIIPIRIAHTQNKIALYEKRFECYQKIDALLNYSRFSARFSSFECTDKGNPVLMCQWEYLAIHDKPMDQKFHKNLLYSEMKYAFASHCLSEDETAFNSMQLLIRIDDKKALDETVEALKTFINSLFYNSGVKEIKRNQECFYEKAYKVECYKRKLENSLQMYRTVFVAQFISNKVKNFRRERNEISDGV